MDRLEPLLIKVYHFKLVEVDGGACPSLKLFMKILHSFAALSERQKLLTIKIRLLSSHPLFREALSGKSL